MKTDIAGAEMGRGGDNTEQTKPARKTLAVRLAWFALLVLLLLLAGGGAYLYLQTQSAQQEGRERQLTRLRTELDAKTQQVALLQQRLRETDGRLDELEADFERLRRRLDGETGWAAAEARYLLSIASHRLTLEKEVDAALAALRTAERLLRRLPDDGLLAAREKLTAAIDALQAVERVDRAGLIKTLGDSAARVEDLPLNELLQAAPATEAPVAEEKKEAATEQTPEQEPTTPETDGLWNKLATPVWQELKSLVEIRKTAAQAVIVWPPEQRYFLYQNLRLQLEAARLTALLRDTDAFRDSAQAALDWLRRYFDQNDAAVKAEQAALQAMLRVEFNPALPSLAATIAALDEYLAALGDRPAAGR